MSDVRQSRLNAVSKSLLAPVRHAAQFFVSPEAAGRKITAGFSFLQRIGKSATTDVWFPHALKCALDTHIAAGRKLGPEQFPAEWAAVRQFELLQEAGNYKIYDLNAAHLTRTLVDLTRSMRGGGYRITVASIGSYDRDAAADDLEILDRRLQDRISALTHMLYLEGQSQAINAVLNKKLNEERWDYRTALPHIGVTLGAKDLFRPVRGGKQLKKVIAIPSAPHRVTVDTWMNDAGVRDAETGRSFFRVNASPEVGQYTVEAGIYSFAAADEGRDIAIFYVPVSRADGLNISSAEHTHKRARYFFDILALLPHRHIAHDMAVGLQLPDANAENEWIYLAEGENTLRAFNSLMADLFSPFDGVSLSGLHGRENAEAEIKASVQHMRGYGDRLNADADKFFAGLIDYTLQ